jgi:hypothetical protein
MLCFKLSISSLCLPVLMVAEYFESKICVIHRNSIRPNSCGPIPLKSELDRCEQEGGNVPGTGAERGPGRPLGHPPGLQQHEGQPSR